MYQKLIYHNAELENRYLSLFESASYIYLQEERVTEEEGPVFREHQKYRYSRVFDKTNYSYIAKIFTISPDLIVENVKFYKDYLFAKYLAHDKIYSPVRVYQSPSLLMLFNDIRGKSLEQVIIKNHVNQK